MRDIGEPEPLILFKGSWSQYNHITPRARPFLERAGAEVIVGNVVITRLSREGRVKVCRHVGESIKTSFVKSSGEPQISVGKNFNV